MLVFREDFKALTEVEVVNLGLKSSTEKLLYGQMCVDRSKVLYKGMKLIVVASCVIMNR